jgi:hypothetical protein
MAVHNCAILALWAVSATGGGPISKGGKGKYHSAITVLRQAARTLFLPADGDIRTGVTSNTEVVIRHRMALLQRRSTHTS